MFYGKECPHCHIMMPFIDKLAKQVKDIKFEKLEVWHDEKNAAKMNEFEAILHQACEGEIGVPAFVDVDENRALCGEVSFEDFKRWAKNKKSK